MASKFVILSLFLIFSSYFHLGLSETTLPQLSLNLAGDNMQCIQKLLPCQPYLKPLLSGTPPATCCQPLMDMIAKDADCLCNVFNNPQMLQSMNVTKDEALELPKACGADVDVSKCNKGYLNINFKSCLFFTIMPFMIRVRLWVECIRWSALSNTGFDPFIADSSSTNSPSGGSKADPTDKSNSTDSKSSTNKITPHEVTQFGVCGLAALMVALVYSA
ncbi:lipid transfer-like protein VAS [Senna tora]|uniref:Lipid transfer-like protein VAS n=1 Tax=Senna tora TaxID=362788 RepID=A0A834T3E7_9FABA|nr:lipid transfer-like protein VAS [Senna tora]